MQSTALIVHVQDAVMMIGIRRRGGNADMVMTGDGRRLVHVERVLVDQR